MRYESNCNPLHYMNHTWKLKSIDQYAKHWLIWL